MKLTSSNLNFFPRSLVTCNGVEYGQAQTDSGKRLVVLAMPNSDALNAFEGEFCEHGDRILLVGPRSPSNAASLRSQLSFLQPRLLGLSTSAGMGDRLGMATGGHIRAVRAVQGKVAPIFAQQSIREMSRTGRTPQQVMDDATWAVFEEGWQNGMGADADHLKTLEDIDGCLAAGFTFFTIDPGAFVDNRADTASQDELRELAEKLPSELQPAASGLMDRHFQIEHLSLKMDEGNLLKAAVKYGRAVDHVAAMYRHLAQAAGQRDFELEVSVDETDQPTSHSEHLYIASELRRLGVHWVSLAPRYIGRFEKGVDYIGDLNAFESDFTGHAAIARQLGPYKLSLHSGSDKFSIYPAVMRQARGLVHLKTAGTSYLEALRAIAALDPGFFKEIYAFARERYETDKKSYHVSAELDRAPMPEVVSDWPGLLEQFDARQILHVTFGSVLSGQGNAGQPCFYNRFMTILRDNPEIYAANLEKHFIRHLKPFCPGSGSQSGE
ncbi:MAG: tagaturonate epimerase family protein [Omnitrophica WOR_2 bacterium]